MSEQIERREGWQLQFIQGERVIATIPATPELIAALTEAETPTLAVEWSRATERRPRALLPLRRP